MERHFAINTNAASLAFVLLCALFVAAAAVHPIGQVFEGGETRYTFWETDSFFHAARILTVAENPAAFYEYDAQAGTAITWPWGYDFLVGAGLYVLGAVAPRTDPTGILVWLPVALGFLNVFLFALLVQRLRLPALPAAAAILLFALSPLTQGLHFIGRIDPHMLELSFVMLALISGKAWFDSGNSTRPAIAHGLVLGLTSLVHNGLFVLALPTVLTLFYAWVRGASVRGAERFALAYFSVTLALCIPSSYFRAGEFSFYFLSWFHVYVAFAVLLGSWFLARFAFNRRNLALLLTAAALLALPLLAEIRYGMGFMTGDLPWIGNLLEVRSLFEMEAVVPDFYSYLLYGLPVLVLCQLLWLRDDPCAARVFVSASILFGFTMLLLQFRFSYYGYFALPLPLLLLLTTGPFRRLKRHALVQGVVAALLVLQALPTAASLTRLQPLGGVPSFFYQHPLILRLAEYCRRDPGLVFTEPSLGHFVRYYTTCPVLVNTMLITPADLARFTEYERLSGMDARQLISARPDIRYLLLGRVGTIDRDVTLAEKAALNEGLVADLILGRGEKPPGLEIIGEMRVPGWNADPYPVAILARVTPDPGPPVQD